MVYTILKYFFSFNFINLFYFGPLVGAYKLLLNGWIIDPQILHMWLSYLGWKTRDEFDYVCVRGPKILFLVNK